jgi:D-alanyl-D-alanine carboxypeptidase (penicillin-binding protein 5/6)
MRFLVFLLALLPFAASHAQPVQAPTLSARAWILMDYATGQVLAAQEADTRLEPASLTKVMTTYLVAEALAQKTLSLQQPVTVSERAWRTQGSRSFVPVNKGVLVDELFKGMVIQSGNDASVALAEAIGGTEDAVCRDDEPHGAAPGPQGHEFPQFQRLFRRPGTDPLFDRARPRQAGRGADPRPSGNPCPACDEGIHLQRHPPAQPQPPAVGRPDRGWPQDRPFQRRRLLPDRHRQARPAAPDLGGARHRLGGSPRPRFAQPAQLGLHGLRRRSSSTTRARPFRSSGVQGRAELVGAGFAEDFVVSVPRGMADKLSAQLVSRQPLLAPIAAGSPVGTLKLAVNGQPWGEYPVVAQAEVPVAGLVRPPVGRLRLYFQ